MNSAKTREPVIKKVGGKLQLTSKIQCRYTPDANTHPPEDDICCGVCGDVMKQERGCFGPRTMVSAMSGYKEFYDDYTCPNSKSDWHKQIVALRASAIKTPSAKIAALLEQESAEILQSRKATKVCSETY